MKAKHRRPLLGAAALGLALGSLTGCQTNIAGMTLPSGWYLQHPPQYIPPSPTFPLSRELASQEAIAAQTGSLGGPGMVIAPPPPPIVPPPAPAMQPVAPAPAPAPAPAAAAPMDK